MDIKVDISVIICTRNRCESLKETLQSLLRQKQGGHEAYEIIVVDNQSTDRTKEVADEFVPKFNGRLRYVFESSTGLSFARNKGIQEAKGAIIAFTDDDCVIDSQWVHAIYQCARETNFEAMGGKILPVYPPETPRWIKANVDLLCGPIVFHDYGDETKLYRKPMLEMVGANMAFRRTIFNDCGLFRTDLGAGRGTMGEDTEFFKRLAQKTQKIYYCGNAVVQHPVDLRRLSLKSIARWNMALARYRFIVDEHARIDGNLKTFLGVPRYLIREVVETAFSLPLRIFNRREFLKAWIKLSLKLGTISEIRRRNRCSQCAQSA